MARAVFTALSILSIISVIYTEKLWAISHMANSENVIGWSLAAGANAFEVDVEFDSSGAPLHSYHGTPCDCSCFITEGVCQFPISHICTGRHDLGSMFSYFMSHELHGQVALVYIDSKMDNVAESRRKEAGKNVISMLEDKLFSLNYQGKVLVGGGNGDYLESVVKSIKQSQYHNQIYITYDMYSSFSSAIQFMAGLNFTKKVATAGISMCVQDFNSFEPEAVVGRINVAKGVISDTIIWTLDREEQWDWYYDFGARGIISNDIANLVNWAKKRGYELYNVTDEPQVTTAGLEAAVLSRGSCQCVLKNDGCVIHTPAPDYSACKCTLQDKDCIGKVVGCKETSDKTCKQPDKTYTSCKQGNGDCSGYTELESCECTFHKSGCKITKPAPKGKACRCSLDMTTDERLYCTGEVVNCRQPDSSYCTNSTIIQTCLQGGGNCNGYEDELCECKKNRNGCYISGPSTNDTACSCRLKDGQCIGSVEQCRDENAAVCKNPNITLQSCVQGLGNCNGYSPACDCYHAGNGCMISNAAPPGTACNCYSMWFFGYSCYGKVVSCGVHSGEKCQAPDTKRESCHQGLGNCAGY